MIKQTLMCIVISIFKTHLLSVFVCGCRCPIILAIVQALAIVILYDNWEKRDIQFGM